MAARELKQPSGWRLRGVPILGYHGLGSAHEKHGGTARDRKYSVLDTEFRNQLQCIRECGFGVVRIRELCPPATRAKFSSNTVVLSFDDGLVSQYERALPILAEFNMSACFFLATAVVGQPGFLTWTQIAEMQRAGMTFHSHGHDHVFLSRLSPAAVEVQLRRSRSILEDHLGCGVRILSVPFGDINRRIVETALAVGYQAVCNSHDWPAQPGATVLNRTAVRHSTSKQDYARLIAGDALTYLKRALREKTLLAPKRILLRFGFASASSSRLASVEEK